VSGTIRVMIFVESFGKRCFSFFLSFPALFLSFYAIHYLLLFATSRYDPSTIDRIMLSGAESRKPGYQTRNCIYSQALAVPRRQIRNRASFATSTVAIDVVGAVIKSNDAIEIPFLLPRFLSFPTAT
jgi:hypothetical protein